MNLAYSHFNQINTLMNNYIVLIFVLLSSNLYSQSSILINQTRWSDPVAWQNSSTPSIKAFGEQSDSLKNIYGMQFLFHNQRYYHVNSWADYYLWFTQKYSYMFNLSAELYKFYYNSGDNFAMMDYVFNYFRGGILPTIRVDLGNGDKHDVRNFEFNSNRFRREERAYKRDKDLKIANKPIRSIVTDYGSIRSYSSAGTSGNTGSSNIARQNQSSPHISKPKDQ